MPSKQTEKESTTPTPPRSARTRRRRTALMAAIAVLVVATTMIARYASSRVESSGPNTSSEALASAAPVPAPLTASVSTSVSASLPEPVEVAPVERPRAPKANVAKPKQTPVVATARSKEHSAPSQQPTAASADEELASRTIAAEAATVVYPVTSTSTQDAAGLAPVTITGCLETTVDGDEFRLIDTEGADAPMARTWRSGFLKKRAAPVQLVEFSDRLALRKYVGRRVVATGLLQSRELHVRSFQSAGSSCH
jgi:hypothetical protein